MKNKSLLLLFLLIACQSETTVNTQNYSKIQGETMGTVYNITYSSDKNYKPKIDSLLRAINNEVSVYEPNALITKFNKSETGIEFSEYENGKHFLMNFKKSKEIYQIANGLFDPTVMPLVNYWGFGYTPRNLTQVDSLSVDTLLQSVGFQKINYTVENRNWTRKPKETKEKRQVFFVFKKENPKTELDFGAIAKGYGVDAVGELLEKHGVQNYLVEIGGELRTKGKNPKGEKWTLAINTPKAGAAVTDYEAIILLENQSMATSGNYRNFHTIEGKKYSHTINPTTGFPEVNKILSASVITTDCMSADAYATAFMVMGLDSAFSLASRLPNLEAYFIYGDEQGAMEVKYTEGVGEMLVSEK